MARWSANLKISAASGPVLVRSLDTLGDGYNDKDHSGGDCYCADRLKVGFDYVDHPADGRKNADDADQRANNPLDRCCSCLVVVP